MKLTEVHLMCNFTCEVTDLIMDSKTSSINNYIKEQGISIKDYRSSFPIDVVDNPALKKLTEEGYENFYHYIEWLGLANYHDLVILPSTNHFYYAVEDLKEVRAIINLRQLNYIKYIKEFFHTIFNVVPQKCYFIGLFIDRKNQSGPFSYKNKVQEQNTSDPDTIKNGIASSIPVINMIYNIIDSRFTRNMTKRIVTLMLEDSGMKVLDMTELNGFTYFCCQKVRLSKV